MFKVGDKVRIKSLNEILDVEGVEYYWEVREPLINEEMFKKLGSTGKVTSTSTESIKIDDEWWYHQDWLEKIEEETRVEEFEKGGLNV